MRARNLPLIAALFAALPAVSPLPVQAGTLACALPETPYCRSDDSLCDFFNGTAAYRIVTGAGDGAQDASLWQLWSNTHSDPSHFVQVVPATRLDFVRTPDTISVFVANPGGGSYMLNVSRDLTIRQVQLSNLIGSLSEAVQTGTCTGDFE